MRERESESETRDWLMREKRSGTSNIQFYTLITEGKFFFEEQESKKEIKSQRGRKRECNSKIKKKRERQETDQWIVNGPEPAIFN